MKWWLLLAGTAATCVEAAPHRQATPDCSGADNWPAGMAYTKLSNAGLLEKEFVLDTQSRMLVTQRIRVDLWRQVFRVTFRIKAKPNVEAIVVSDASSEECSMSEPEVFLIGKAL